MKTTKVLGALTALAISGGCATHQPISDVERQAIRSVTVPTKVPIPEKPYVHGPSASAGFFVLGPIGSLVGQGDDVERFKNHLDHNKIDIAGIVRQELVTYLNESKVFPAIVTERADANFELTIESYGLGPGFSMRPVDKPLRPTLRLVAKLSSADGKVLWQNSEYITGVSGEMPAHRFDDYLNNAALTKEAFAKAAHITIRELLKDLAAQPSPKQ